MKLSQLRQFRIAYQKFSNFIESLLNFLNRHRKLEGYSDLLQEQFYKPDALILQTIQELL